MNIYGQGSKRYFELLNIINEAKVKFETAADETANAVLFQRVGPTDMQLPVFAPVPQASFDQMLASRLLQEEVSFREVLLADFLGYIKKELNFTDTDDTHFLDELVNKFLLEMYY